MFGLGGKYTTTGKNEDCLEEELLIPINEEDKIFNNLSGKADCVYQKLQNLSSDFKDMI